MNVIIKELSNDSKQIEDVQTFLFKMIKKEFGYDYVPEWHQDIVRLDEYYINPERNNFFVAYLETGEIIATIGIRAYDKDFPEFRHLYSMDTTSSIWNICILIKIFQGLWNFGQKWVLLFPWIPMMNC